MIRAELADCNINKGGGNTPTRPQSLIAFNMPVTLAVTLHRPSCIGSAATGRAYSSSFIIHYYPFTTTTHTNNTRQQAG